MPSPVPPKTLSEALVALQAQLPRIPKTDEAQVGTRTYRYANLATITDLLMPLMAALGLCWTCRPTTGGFGFVLEYQLRHVSGEMLEGWYPLPSSGTPQQIGSAITYARRYALTAVTGIAPADDDDDAAAAERAAQTDPEREAAGRMTAAQQKEHAALARMPRGRRADRSNDPADADPWTDQPAGQLPPMAAEDEPGSSNERQWKRLGILYTAAGITDTADRHADATNRIGRVITSAKQLSYVEAEQVASELEKLAAARLVRERGQ